MDARNCLQGSRYNFLSTSVLDLPSLARPLSPGPSFSRPEELYGSSISLSGNLHPQFFPRDPPSLIYRRIGTSRLANPLSILWVLEPRDPIRRSTLTSTSAVGTSLYRVLAPRDANRLTFQTPIHETPKRRTRDLAPSEPRYSRDQMISSSTFETRDAEMLIPRLSCYVTLLWPTLSTQSSGLHFSPYRDSRDQIFRSLLTNSRYADPRVGTYAPRNPDRWLLSS
jgi:hypothetical protein